jgi:hypothetical protein
MSSLIGRVALVALASVATGAKAGAILEGFDNPERIPDQYIVTLNETPGWSIHLGEPETRNLSRTERASALQRDRTQVGAIASELAMAYRGKTLALFHAALKGFAVQMSDADAREMAVDPRIAVISADAPVTVTTTQTSAPWHLARISQRSLPLGNTYTYYLSGVGVNVYVIDTGVEGATHGWDIYQTVANGCYNQTFNTFSCVVPTSGHDCYIQQSGMAGHGTETATVINDPVYGVAKDAIVYDVKIFGCSGGAQYLTWVAGINFILAEQGESGGIINMSIASGQAGTNTALANAISAAIGAGYVVVGSAGPDTPQNGQPYDSCQYATANIPGVISVGATDDTDAISAVSAVGNCVTLYAPGENVPTKLPNGLSTIETGMSIAVPQVSGVAALWGNSNGFCCGGGVTPLATAGLTSGATGNVVHPAGGFISNTDLLLSSCIYGNNADLNPNEVGFCGAGAGGPPPPNNRADAVVYELTHFMLLQ